MMSNLNNQPQASPDNSSAAAGNKVSGNANKSVNNDQGQSLSQMAPQQAPRLPDPQAQPNNGILVTGGPGSYPQPSQ